MTSSLETQASRAPPADATLEFRVLGPLEVVRNGVPAELGGRLPSALVADLVLHLDEPVSVDRLVDDLWGEAPPATAVHMVEVYVSKLRKALEPDRARGDPPRLLVRTRAGYALEVPDGAVDARRFELLADQGRQLLEAGDNDHAAETLRVALALWRGPALAEFGYEPFAQAEIVRLEELRLRALEDRVDADLRLGEGAQLVAELEGLVASEPLRERFRAQLMVALYQAGRQADALAAYHSARRALVEELGLEPGDELRELERSILDQDPALSPPGRASVIRAPAPAPREVRRVVTILFADVSDSTALGEELDPETLRALMTRWFETASACLERHGGTVEKFIGDAVMAVFGSPVAHEDDALRAVRAAADIGAAVAELNDRLERELGVLIAVRIGVDTGEVIAGDTGPARMLISGDAVNVATRFQEVAAPGEIVIGDATHRLVAGAVRAERLPELELKGKRRPVTAWRVGEVVADAPGLVRRLDVALVGREPEFAELRAEFDRACGERAVRLVTVLGPPGIGKSRLAQELASLAASDATVLRGRCLSYGEGNTYWPLAEIVRDAAGEPSRAAVEALVEGEQDGGSVADRVAAAFGLGEATYPVEEIAWAFRRLFETLARKRPLVLVVDDVHWAEPTLLDLLEHVAALGRDAPILLVCLARDDLLDERPGWGEGLPNTATIALDSLTHDEAERLLELLGGSPIDEAARRRILETAEGNPLFLEQLLALAQDDPAFDPAAGAPPTIQALLAARLDRLGPGERAVIERAAVIGREFWPAPIAELLPPAARGTVARHLESLSRRDFVHPDRPAPPFGDAFRFRHVLIQDAAYRAIPKAQRATLHEQLADLLDRAAPDEPDEIVGYHLERAYGYRAELGPVDRHARRLAEDAGRRLGAAGIRALKRTDMPATVSLLGRATTLLPASDPRHCELLCELAVGLRATGDIERAEIVLTEAVAESEEADERRVGVRAGVELAYVRLLADPAVEVDELIERSADAIPILESVGDDRALGRVWLLIGWAQGAVRCQNRSWEDAAARAFGYYRSANWPASWCLGQLAAALYHGPTPVPTAIERCDALLEETADLAGRANVLAYLGGLEAMRCHSERGRELLDRAGRICKEIGLDALAVNVVAIVGELELLGGNPAVTADALRTSCEELTRTRDHSALATRAADLAEAEYVLERYDEAQRWCRVSESVGVPEDLSGQYLRRGVEAKLLARAGAFEGAVSLGRTAVALANQTDALNQRAKVALDLAEVFHLVGQPEAGSSVTEEAVGLYEEKGNIAAVSRLRSVREAKSEEVSGSARRAHRGLFVPGKGDA